MFHLNQNDFQKTLASTGFAVSAFSYLFFWLCELLRPGFVARYFSVHYFLIAAVIFGIWWGLKDKGQGRLWVVNILAILLGIALAVLLWKTGSVLGIYQIPACVLVGVAPIVFVRLIET